MPRDRDTHAFGEHNLSERLAPAPPPPMPTPDPAPAPPPSEAGKPAPGPPNTPTAAPGAEEPAAAPSGWEVDSRRLGSFAHAVEQARDRLLMVQAKVERMQTTSYTPKLGISPVGVQLERKFTDRLDARLDNPERPTSGGLRPMLAEAMRRMEEFVAGAEAAAKSYDEHESEATTQVGRSGQSSGTPASTASTQDPPASPATPRG